MPLYEYRCTSCGYGFEKIQSFSAAPETVCPKCEGVLVRPVTAPALRFEGAGWYVNDYAGKGGSKPADAPAEAAAPGSAATTTESKPDAGATATESKPAAPAAAAASPTPATGS